MLSLVCAVASASATKDGAAALVPAASPAAAVDGLPVAEFNKQRTYEEHYCYRGSGNAYKNSDIQAAEFTSDDVIRLDGWEELSNVTKVRPVDDNGNPTPFPIPVVVMFYTE